MTDTADKEVGRKQGILFSHGQHDFSVHNSQLSQYALEEKNGKPIDMRVKDCRENESSPVVLCDNMRPHENGQTSVMFFH